MKKLALYVLVLIFVVLLSGCGDSVPKNVKYEHVFYSDVVSELEKNPIRVKEYYVGKYIAMLCVPDSVYISPFDEKSNHFSIRGPIYKKMGFNKKFKCVPKSETVQNVYKSMNLGSICIIEGKIKNVNAFDGLEIDVYNMIVNCSRKKDGLTYKRYSEDELFGDLKRNIQNAMGKYFGQQIQFVGKISGVFNGKLLITSVFYPMCNIMCTINDKYTEQEVAKVKYGDVVVVEGALTGMSNDSLLEYELELHNIYEYSHR